MLGGIWEIAFCASPSGGLLGQAMASVYSAGQVADALLADAEFRALKLGTWLNTPSGELVAAAVMALTAAPFKQDIDLLIEGLQLAAQRQQAEARPKLAVGLLGVRPWPSPSARPAARPTPGSSGPAPPRIRLTHGPGVPGEDVAVKDRGQVLGLATGPLV